MPLKSSVTLNVVSSLEGVGLASCAVSQLSFKEFWLFKGFRMALFHLWLVGEVSKVVAG